MNPTFFMPCSQQEYVSIYMWNRAEGTSIGAWVGWPGRWHKSQESVSSRMPREDGSLSKVWAVVKDCWDLSEWRTTMITGFGNMEAAGDLVESLGHGRALEACLERTGKEWGRRRPQLQTVLWSCFLQIRESSYSSQKHWPRPLVTMLW